MVIRIYLAAARFEMLGLKDTIMYKIVDVAFASHTVSCGTLQTIYLYIKPDDGMRELMDNLVAYRSPSAWYRIHFSSWNLKILQDLLIAVKDVHGVEPYANSLRKYLSAISFMINWLEIHSIFLALLRPALQDLLCRRST
jgi:hypothetical protein